MLTRCKNIKQEWKRHRRDKKRFRCLRFTRLHEFCLKSEIPDKRQTSGHLYTPTADKEPQQQRFTMWSGILTGISSR